MLGLRTQGPRPAAIHDMDGDDMPEIVVGAANTHSMFEADLTEV